MEIVKFIEQCLNQVHERLSKSLQDLRQEELTWRPAPHANCIAEIVWHIVRSEELIAGRLRDQEPEVWESQQWQKRFGYSDQQMQRAGFQFMRVLGTPPKLEDLLDYMEAVHQDILNRLQQLSPDDLDRASDPERPERNLAMSLRHIITHINNHHGQVDYIRGLMQPGWDLPPLTGIIKS